MNRILAVGTLALLLVVAVLYAVKTTRSALLTSDTCAATAAGEHDHAIMGNSELVVEDDEDAFVTCRCSSLVALGRVQECGTLLTSRGAPVPEVLQVAAALLEAYDGVDGQLASRAAQAAVRLAPQPPHALVERAIALSVPFDGRFWEEQAKRSAALSLSIAHITLASDPHFALKVIGASPGGAQHETWRMVKARILAHLGDEAGGLSHLEESVTSGTPRAVAEADFALSQGEAMRSTPRGHTALLTAWAQRAALDPLKAAGVANSLAQYYAAKGDDLALKTLMRECDADNVDVRRDVAQIDRSIAMGEFDISTDIDGALLVSPDPEGPVDAAYVEYRVHAGERVRIMRHAGDHPVRCVVRDSDGNVRAAAHLWPTAARQDVMLNAEAAWTRPEVGALPTRDADGVRRLVVVVVDSGDWRLVNFGYATRQLPMLEALHRVSLVGILNSDPPSTVTAMARLIAPSSAADTPMQLERLGQQLQAATAQPKNLLREINLFTQTQRRTLIDVVAEKKHVMNMLFGHGAIQAGEAGLTGPAGREPIAQRTVRHLTEDDDLSLPLLQENNSYRAQFEAAAAQFDDLVGYVSAKKADLYLYRYDPTDILAHEFLSKWSSAGKIERKSLFFDSYRYLDRRLRDVSAAMDADDVLMVISDHGTKNSANHDKMSLLMMYQKSVDGGHVASPQLRHLPSWIVRILCLDEPWGFPVPDVVSRCGE
jgi:hypothetical protein